MCNNAHSEIVQNNIRSEETKFSIHVHKAVDILQSQSVCKNVDSEVIQNNLHPEGTKFVHRAVDILQGKRKMQCVYNNAHSEEFQNNLQAEGIKFSIQSSGHITG